MQQDRTVRLKVLNTALNVISKSASNRFIYQQLNAIGNKQKITTQQIAKIPG